jgi:Sec-independent protein translocase protein TatA
MAAASHVRADRATRYHPAMPELLGVLVVILILVLMWRGPKTLPRLGEALGRGIREARREASELTKSSDEEPPKG